MEFQEEQFFANVKALRERFDRNNPNNLYPFNTAKNIPMDGLAVYVAQTWEQIRNNKELNLPNQREMVANFRCSELKDEALENVKDIVDQLKRDCDK